MCVIVAVDTDGKRPSREHIDAFWEKNSDGAGIAWLDGEAGKKGTKVVFQKGLTLDEIRTLIASAPLPFVAHFRIATCGGVIKRLTHPFIVSKESPLILKGSTTDPVVFHNGVWSMWEKKIIDTASFTGWKVPQGPWSDSRAMAWFAAHVGVGILDLIAAEKQRLVTLDPENGLHLAGDWEEVEPENFWVSNKLWFGAYRSRKGVSGAQVASSPSSQNRTGTAETGTPGGTAVDLGLAKGPVQTATSASTTRQITGPASCSPAIENGSDQTSSGAQGVSLPADPFEVTLAKPGLSISEKLQQLENTMLLITEERTRHRMTKAKYRTLKSMFERRKKGLLQVAKHVERHQAASQQASTSPASALQVM